MRKLDRIEEGEEKLSHRRDNKHNLLLLRHQVLQDQEDEGVRVLAQL